VNRVVLDASVVLKWYLPDELYDEKALGLLKAFMSGTLDIVAPALLAYELVNALVIAGKRGRLDEGAVMAALEGFKGLGIPLLDPAGHYDRIIHHCHAYGRSAYDSAYLALAEQENLDLITADERLFNSVKAALPWVRWIGAYE
jgi:predicted nucleic acid-binding protein